MAFQAVPDGVEVVFHAVQNGVPIVNVYHVKDSSTLDATRLGVIADTFKDWWDDDIQPNISDSYVLNDITATALEVSTGPQVVRSYTTGNQGALSGAQAAGNAAVVISWRTANIGRSFRGRTYIGGLSQASLNTAQYLTGGATTGFATAATNLIDVIDGIGAALAVLSRFALGVARVTGLLTEITSIIIDNVVDSQRRRTAN